MNLIAAANRLADRVDQLSFGSPITHVYNPLRYAARNYHAYLSRYGVPPKRVVLVGMNPGPWGMAQTGVPFGDAKMIREWLKLTETVDQPSRVHPKRPIQGMDCARSEVSGTRLWGAIAAHFGTPEKFFRQFFVANYCPLAFMEESGRNFTPDKLPKAEQAALFAACDEHLRAVVEFFQPEFVVGIGAFAEGRARHALASLPRKITIGRVLHPSPASPAANREWAKIVTAELQRLGICECPTAATSLNVSCRNWEWRRDSRHRRP